MGRSAEGSTSADPWRLESALNGDRQAWAGLIDEFGETIWQWARRIGLNAEDAEDVCQSVWFLLKEKGSSIEDPRRLPGWLATTTRYEALAVARKRARREKAEAPIALLGDQQLRSSSPDAADIVLANDARSSLVRAFETLPQRCKDLLPLLWAKTLSYSEISEVLSMPVGSIGPNKKRCLDNLRVAAR